MEIKEMIETPQGRLKLFIQTSYTTIEAFVKEFGTNQGYLGRYINQGTSIMKNNVSLKKLEMMGLNVNWYLHGVGSMFAKNERGQKLQQIAILSNNNTLELIEKYSTEFAEKNSIPENEIEDVFENNQKEFFPRSIHDRWRPSNPSLYHMYHPANSIDRFIRRNYGDLFENIYANINKLDIMDTDNPVIDNLKNSIEQLSQKVSIVEKENNYLRKMIDAYEAKVLLLEQLLPRDK